MPEYRRAHLTPEDERRLAGAKREAHPRSPGIPILAPRMVCRDLSLFSTGGGSLAFAHLRLFFFHPSRVLTHSGMFVDPQYSAA